MVHTLTAGCDIEDALLIWEGVDGVLVTGTPARATC